MNRKIIRVISESEREYFQEYLDLATNIDSLMKLRLILVGGSIRDLLIRGDIVEPEIDDLDFMLVDTDGHGVVDEIDVLMIELAKLDYSIVNDGREFLHFKVIRNGFVFDIGTPRTEIYDEYSRNPKVKVGSLRDDYFRRDFTVNAFFAQIVKVDDRVELELCGDDELISRSYDDLLSTTLNTTQYESNVVFEEDPLRILRAIRFMGYGFQCSKEMSVAIDNFDMNIFFRKVSKERVAIELKKILRRGDLDYFFDHRIVNKIIPEFDNFINREYEFDEIEHIKNVILKSRELSNDDMFLLVALFHDLGKSITGTIHKSQTRWAFLGHEDISSKWAYDTLRRYRFDNQTCNSVRDIVKMHMSLKWISNWKKGTIVKFILKHSPTLIRNILVFNHMDWGGKSEEWKIKYNVAQSLETIDEIVNYWIDIVDEVVFFYSNELREIGVNANANKNIPRNELRNIIIGEKMRFILNKEKLL